MTPLYILRVARKILFQTNINTRFSSIWPINRTLSGATTLGDSDKQESDDDSNKQNGWKRGCFSSTISLVQADMGMGEPHSLLAMYASAE